MFCFVLLAAKSFQSLVHSLTPFFLSFSLSCIFFVFCSFGREEFSVSRSLTHPILSFFPFLLPFFVLICSFGREVVLVPHSVTPISFVVAWTTSMRLQRPREDVSNRSGSKRSDLRQSSPRSYPSHWYDGLTACMHALSSNPTVGHQRTSQRRGAA